MKVSLVIVLVDTVFLLSKSVDIVTEQERRDAGFSKLEFSLEEIKILENKRACLSRESRNLRGRSGMTETVVVIEWMSSESKPTPGVRDRELPSSENWNVRGRVEISGMVVETATVWRQVSKETVALNKHQYLPTSTAPREGAISRMWEWGVFL